MDMLGGEEATKNLRWPSIMADAAYAILTADSSAFTGRFCIDEDVLRQNGVVDFDQYAVQPGSLLVFQLFFSLD